MIESIVYTGPNPGPKLLVLGAVHGNEKCGTLAIKRICREFDEGRLKILRGQATFSSITNRRAYENNVRFVERNLNRYLVPMAEPDCYEAQLGNVLCPMLAACDVLLDIPCYTVGGPPF